MIEEKKHAASVKGGALRNTTNSSKSSDSTTTSGKQLQFHPLLADIFRMILRPGYVTENWGLVRGRAS
jgi:hypothetical protein